MRNLFAPQSAIELMPESGSKKTPRRCAAIREIKRSLKWGGEEKVHDLANKLQRRSSLVAHLYDSSSLHSLCFISFLKSNNALYVLSSQYRGNGLLSYIITIIMVHPVLYSLYSCNSCWDCCFISCSNYFIHTVINPCHIVSFLSSIMCILLRAREVNTKNKISHIY